jgi:hypothetical protein
MGTAVVVTIYFVCICAARSQEENGADTACDVFKNASPPDLVKYLNGVVPDDKNADCVTMAIRKLGKERYEAAITALVKFLDFRRPPTQDEKRGIYERPQSIDEVFPAALALELIGKNALPELLRAIEATPTSKTARDNAVAVWMEAYKYERPKGVALLKQEETKVNDDTIKQRLTWATQKAVTYCGEPDLTACRQSAATGAL